MLAIHVRTAGSTAIHWVFLIVAAGAGLEIGQAQSAADEPARPGVANVKLKDLLKERVATTRAMAAEVKTRFSNRVETVEQLLIATKMRFDAELDACDTDKERISILEKFVTEAKENEQLAAQLARTGQGTNSAALMAKAERLKAEIALERAKAKVPANPK